MSESNDLSHRQDAQDLVAHLVEEVRKDKDTDVPLFECLERHVLLFSPANDAVDRALRDIQELAATRGEALDTTPNHG